jgi:catechol 2,3-dioxygenase-like lactoylglutathione lyase family enzyme
MGFTALWGEEDGRCAEIDTGAARLAISWREVLAQDRFQVDDAVAVAHRISSAGADQVSAPQTTRPGGVRAARFRDPDGYLIEINNSL